MLAGPCLGCAAASVLGFGPVGWVVEGDLVVETEQAYVVAAQRPIVAAVVAAAAAVIVEVVAAVVAVVVVEVSAEGQEMTGPGGFLWPKEGEEDLVEVDYFVAALGCRPDCDYLTETERVAWLWPAAAACVVAEPGDDGLLVGPALERLLVAVLPVAGFASAVVAAGAAVSAVED